jgi:D-alanyl-D-alanine carboxypeptidase (penicillin-binding protein 5/6)
MKRPINQKETWLSLGIVFIPLIIFFSFVIYEKNKIDYQQNQVAAINQIIENKIEDKEQVVNISISAKSAYVKNLNTGQILFEKNPEQKLPLASLTKIMTALVARQNGDQDQLIKITEQNLLTEGEYFLNSNEIFKLKDLINMSMVASVNDTASALTNVFKNSKNFIEEMNRVAHNIGLENTAFKNETGLDLDNNRPSATGTAKDMTRLIEYVLQEYPEIFAKTNNNIIDAQSITTGQNYRYLNTNEIINQIPGLIGSKTGFTDTAGGNLAMIVDIGLNQPISIVILGSTDNKTRFSDALKILEAIKNKQ